MKYERQHEDDHVEASADSFASQCPPPLRRRSTRRALPPGVSVRSSCGLSVGPVRCKGPRPQPPFPVADDEHPGLLGGRIHRIANPRQAPRCRLPVREDIEMQQQDLTLDCDSF